MQVIDYYHHSLFPCRPWGLEADWMFISCTNFRTIEIIVGRDDAVKPFVTSNQVSMSIALKALEVVGPRGREDYFNSIDCTRVN